MQHRLDKKRGNDHSTDVMRYAIATLLEQIEKYEIVHTKTVVEMDIEWLEAKQERKSGSPFGDPSMGDPGLV